jgi:hypothetical protein
LAGRRKFIAGSIGDPQSPSPDRVMRDGTRPAHDSVDMPTLPTRIDEVVRRTGLQPSAAGGGRRVGRKA